MAKSLFFKHSILDVWEGPEHASVTCYSLFGEIEEANKIDSAKAEKFWIAMRETSSRQTRGLHSLQN